MKIIGMEDSKENPVLITPWSVGHFVAGAVLSKCVSLWTGEVLHFLYEIPLISSEESSYLNNGSDQLIFTAGFLIFK